MRRKRDIGWIVNSGRKNGRLVVNIRITRNSPSGVEKWTNEGSRLSIS